MRNRLMMTGAAALIAIPAFAFAQAGAGGAGVGNNDSSNTTGRAGNNGIQEPGIAGPGAASPGIVEPGMRPYEGRSIGGSKGKEGDVPSDREMEPGSNSGSAHDSE